MATGRRSLGTAALACAAGVVVLASAACTPRDEFDLINRTGTDLYVSGTTLAAGHRMTVDLGWDCIDGVELVSVDLASTAVYDARICEGDDVVLESRHLVAGSSVVTVENHTDVDLRVTLIGIPGTTLVPVKRGDDLAVSLRAGPGACAVVPLIAVEDGATTADGRVFYDGELCDGAIWTLRDATLAAGSAEIIVVNTTDRDFSLTSDGEGAGAVATIRAQDRTPVEIGAPLGGCAEPRLRAEAPDAEHGQVWATPRSGELCDGDEWTIGLTDLWVMSDGRGVRLAGLSSPAP